ncbi:TPA: hypothetical protein MB364_000889 [Klebsiella variicola subsp. variicola]|nr:hypothetical protein [Klebsiella variicola subsp. variicola]
MQTARSIQVKLDSGSAVNFDGTANITPGITGKLGLANGGTGATDAAGARTSLGLKSAALKNTGTSGDAVPLLNAANSWSAKQTFSGTIEVQNAGNSHLFFLNSAGEEKGLVYADDEKNVTIRSGGGKGPTWSFWSSGSCQFPGAITANGTIASQSGGVVATTNYPAGNPNGSYNNSSGVVSRFSNGAYVSLYFQEYVGNFHQGIINVNGFGKDDNWYFRAGGEFYCNGNGNFNDVYIRSDKRAKSNIRIIEDACNKVNRITGNIYDLTTPDGGTVISGGVIAQEVMEVLPDAVTKDRDEDGGLYRVNYNTIIALLVESVKEMSARLQKLEAVKSI